MAQETLICQGAEARVYLHNITYTNRKLVVKERFSKKYRHPILDQRINEARVKTQVKNMQKALKLGINVPLVEKVEGFSIWMEYIDGKTLKHHLNTLNADQHKQEITLILEMMAKSIKEMHRNGLIHGDLTTSNFILRDIKTLYVIDFGLSYIKDSIEDKAVDLYVLEKAFLSTHPHLETIFNEIFFAAYGDQQVIKRLHAVRMRGRKKIAFG